MKMSTLIVASLILAAASSASHPHEADESERRLLREKLRLHREERRVREALEAKRRLSPDSLNLLVREENRRRSEAGRKAAEERRKAEEKESIRKEVIKALEASGVTHYKAYKMVDKLYDI